MVFVKVEKRSDIYSHNMTFIASIAKRKSLFVWGLYSLHQTSNKEDETYSQMTCSNIPAPLCSFSRLRTLTYHDRTWNLGITSLLPGKRWEYEEAVKKNPRESRLDIYSSFLLFSLQGWFLWDSCHIFLITSWNLFLLSHSLFQAIRAHSYGLQYRPYHILTFMPQIFG
jgi:hypothetical protein